jgi:hypothetical protein
MGGIDMPMVRKAIKGNRIKEYQLYDPETGEIIEQTIKLLAYIPKNVEKESFNKVFKTMWVEVLNNPKLKGAPLRVLIWLMGNNSWGNDWIYVDYKELAKELGYTYDTIYRAFKLLKDSNLIIQKKPREKLFRLNPKYIYMGLAVQRKEDMDF